LFSFFNYFFTTSIALRLHLYLRFI
jgi:hypothetical protein